MNLNNNYGPNDEVYREMARKQAEDSYAYKKAIQEQNKPLNQLKQKFLDNPVINSLAKNLKLFGIPNKIIRTVIAGTMAGTVAVGSILLVKNAIDNFTPTITSNEITQIDNFEEKSSLEQAAELAIEMNEEYRTGGFPSEEKREEFTSNPYVNVSSTSAHPESEIVAVHSAMSDVEKYNSLPSSELKEISENHPDELNRAIAEELLSNRIIK